MNTQAIHTQSPNEDRPAESTARRIRVRRRAAASLAAGQERVAAARAANPDRAYASRKVSGARILRRWSVSDLIARAGGAPRAFA
jgi:hypothetical protein